METSANAATQSAVRRKTRFNLIGVSFNKRFVGRSRVSLQKSQLQRLVRTVRKYFGVAVVALRQPRPRSSGRNESRTMRETEPPVAPLNAALLVAAQRVLPRSPTGSRFLSGCHDISWPPTNGRDHETDDARPTKLTRARNSLILGGFSAFRRTASFRGTAVAIGMVTMKNTIDSATNVENKPALSSDWVNAHADYLFNFAFGQVRDTGIAEDLVQETFLAALKARDRFAGESSERTWLVGILRHKIYDHLRKTCRERAVRVDPLPAHDADDAWDESLLWLHDVAEES